VPFHIITDNMAASLDGGGSQVDAVIVGADRIAANGDTANKIGTYSVGGFGKAHKIPFYIAAPTSTFDLSTFPSGDRIPIEQREPFGSHSSTWFGVDPEGFPCF
jgi:methylthioribose-1-phosphate isomerase